MDYIEERTKIVEFGKKLIEERLTTGTGGNLSIYVPEDKVMLISPSGINYKETKLEDVVVMDLDGNVKEGIRKPSSEFAMHSIFYKNDPEVRSVVHCHSDFATAMACLNKDIPPLDYVIGDIGKTIKCTKYQIYGSPEIAEEAYETMGRDKGILLANHGSLAIGKSIEAAMGISKEIEFICKIFTYASAVGKPVILNDEQMDAVIEKFGTYGQPQKSTNHGA
ncbi:class II aldolase/adducin family protein [Lacticaseibacillus paracasei]|uniref:Class II aldolase/adducin N-terminal domain-containing protein n=2 Tax=Lacticaseibacillus paracasei TaxID=1597 RepID=A0A0C9QAI4_LACPA|nr:class II aldolase/adducin family protein [Lacticaseibacillus paracasei]EPC85939.1 class II aldolase/adducin family protein [Lacticaseibacillus paracasei subsp. paracasei CNCM I-4649]MDR7625483.1 class II aldolase/adducin family protein [Lacticaseibacillus paracasei]MXI84416.1 aldolase [Lacticaseibacillus paracasei]QPC12917.1 class II aldolase/adducin family protein [Lacticaseibacillus paracasei subsp. tolerans]QUS98203.1 class II aldolase/adducin family protein [Lacticaseibacillus paracasei